MSRKYYWTCPLCGANLDAGESCDCTSDKTAQIWPVEEERPVRYIATSPQLKSDSRGVFEP